MEEIWKDVEGRFDISNTGKVRNKFTVVKGKNLGDGIELVMPKEILVKNIDKSFFTVGGVRTVMGSKYIDLVCKYFMPDRDLKKELAYLRIPGKPISPDNISFRPRFKVGIEIDERTNIRNDIRNYKRDTAYGLIDLPWG